jgi:hypothetical protein
MRKTLGGALRILWVACAGFLTSLSELPTAIAQDSTTSSAAIEAKKLFAQGSALFLAGRYDQALEVLRRSYDLVPSPNSKLVIARCLRELGRAVEAQQAFAATEGEARRRTEQGAAKYKQTMDSAATEGAALRARLGTIHVRVEGAVDDAKLEVDGASTELPQDGELVLWHEPGEATISLRSGSGLEQKQTVTVRAGAELTVGFGQPESPPPEPAPTSTTTTPPSAAPANASPPMAIPQRPERTSSASSWARPAAIASGVLTVAGAGAFIGFGLASEDVYKNLKKQCGNQCGPSNRNDAQRGQTEQLIANISLVAGSIAAAATATFVIIAASSPARPRTVSPTGWKVVVGATKLGVVAEF